MSFMSHFANDVAIDLGTANTCVFARGRGIVVNEPSIVAFNTAKGQVEAVGQEAYEMLGRTPPNITAVRPMKDGVIADFDAAEKMLSHFVRKAYGRRPLMRPRLVIGVPPEITPVERRAVKDSGFRAKASEVHLVDEPMAAAIGSGLPVNDPSGNMIIDIGGGTTDIAVISMAGTVYGRSLRVAGDAMNEAIATYMKKARNLLIGERTAEQIKWEVGSAAPLDEPLKMEVKGRHVSRRGAADGDDLRPRRSARRSPTRCGRSSRPFATRSSAFRPSCAPTSTTREWSSPAAARCCASSISGSRARPGCPCSSPKTP